MAQSAARFLSEVQVSARTRASYEEVLGLFIDSWLPRKVILHGTLQTRAPAVLRKWAKWSFENGYVDEERYDDILSALPVTKSRETKRLEKASDLLADLYALSPEELLLNAVGRLLPIEGLREPDEVIEGYVQVTRLTGEVGYVKDEDGVQVGPVFFGKALVDALRVGDVMNIEAGRYGKQWRVLASGNVYPESQWMGP